MSVNFDSKSPLLDEIVTSRQLKSENSTLVSINLIYKQQIAKLEVEVSDLKALVTAKNYELKMAKESEINELKKSLNSANSQKVNFPTSDPKENLKKSETVEIEQLKNQLDNEKNVNKLLLAKVQQLRTYIEDFESSHSPFGCSSKLKHLESKIEELSEENEYLKRKFLTPTFIDPVESTRETILATKADITLEESGEIRITNTPHRLKTNFQQDASILRRKSESNKKSLTPGRVVKRFTCNLSDILNSASPSISLCPGLSGKTAEFCPSTMRRLKVQSFVVN
jgi:hypothetical protein